MSTASVSAISRPGARAGSLVLAAGLAALACGGEATSDNGNNHGGGSGGESPAPGDGGASSSGGAVGSGGETGSGGDQIGGGGGLLDNGCNRDTIECVDGWCGCDGVFDQCRSSYIHCDADAEGEAYNCVCGPPPVLITDCEYSLQHRCEPPLASGWVRTCTCDPVYPTDDEPCRYHQAWYDEAGEDLICNMEVADIEPTENWKYYCSCLAPEEP